MPGELQSSLFECRVMHHRLSPKVNRFEYGIFMLWLDLDELPLLDQRLRFFSHNRRNLHEFRDADHFACETPVGTGSSGSGKGLRAAIEAWMADQGNPLPDGAKIFLLTLPRVAGFVFNPVSFYFIEDSGGVSLGAIAEVQNTFGEVKPYFVPVSGDPAERFFRLRVPKHFYVSPFSPLSVDFDFRLRRPDGRLQVGVNDISGDRTILISALTGHRVPLSDTQLLRLTFQYPLVTLRVVFLIHWQALKLWTRRLPWHRKAEQAEMQSGVLRPHATIRIPATETR